MGRKRFMRNGPKLIEIKNAKKVVFVGDTHGDFEVSQKIIKDYLKEGNKIVFLGDYVDRGPQSRENLDFLLEVKVKNPNQVYLLQGNHEGHRIIKFYPAEFWESLSETEYKKYASIVEKLPLIVITQDIIALHGALPDCVRSDLAQIKLGSEEWQQITWGDFVDEHLFISTLHTARVSDEPGEYLGIDPFTGRPQFGRDYFLKIMERFKKKVLIRSHQPTSPLFMFDNRCLTIFTSSAYTRERTIAIADFKKPIKNAKDLEIKRI